VKEFQRVAHVKANGKLTPRTVNEMNKPRCGNRDLRIEDGDELDWTNAIKSVKTRRRRNLEDYDSPGRYRRLKILIHFKYHINNFLHLFGCLWSC